MVRQLDPAVRKRLEVVVVRLREATIHASNLSMMAIPGGDAGAISLVGHLEAELAAIRAQVVGVADQLWRESLAEATEQAKDAAA